MDVLAQPAAQDAPPRTAPPPPTPCLLESWFPVAALSLECCKERQAGASQTLTRLGKWWGRKPLILVRAALLGALLPATDNPRRDRAVFLKLLTMDPAGLCRRRRNAVPLRALAQHVTAAERRRFLDLTGPGPRWRATTSAADRERLQRAVFQRLPHDRQLALCARPEQLDGPDHAAWRAINAHLGTHADSLPTLVAELGRRRFGHPPRVADAFSGGGSIPFEAARLGCDVRATDLDPVATLLTWAALHLVGGERALSDKIHRAQSDVLAATEHQLAEWQLTHNEAGEQAEYHLYCTEATCPACGWTVPLAPSWLISVSLGTIARLVPRPRRRRYDLEIHAGVSAAAQRAARAAGTVRRGQLHCPRCSRNTPLSLIREERGAGLRPWTNDDIVPRPADVLQERLYAIRWRDPDGQLHYRAPTAADLQREQRVLAVLHARFATYQSAGYLPIARIERGVETARLPRERGWTHWHHLFHPRQLLTQGLLMEQIARHPTSDPRVRAALLLGVGVCCNWNSRLCVWNPDHSKGPGSTEQTFLNLALNPLHNYGVRTLSTLRDNFALRITPHALTAPRCVAPADARDPGPPADLWITDPPFADAANYHELSHFFHAWYAPHLPALFPAWNHDPRHHHAVHGSGTDFRRGMVDCYRHLAARLPPAGVHIVMFAHRDPAVWTDLALILCAAGLCVTAAWCVQTETSTAGYKRGRYAEHILLLVLRRHTDDRTLTLREVASTLPHELRTALRRSRPALRNGNQKSVDPRLATYAAVLRVLTRHPIRDADALHALDADATPDVAAFRAQLAAAIKTDCAALDGHDPSAPARARKPRRASAR